jgi:beta-lactamase regulating signal transducer with metallopeptidase domain
MTFLSFLGWWALRSSVVAITTAVLLKLFRVRSPSVRLASWTAAMLASTLIPLLAPALPAVYLPAAPIRGLARVAQQSNLRLPPSIHVAGNTVSANNGISHAGRASRPFAWPPLLLSIYGLGASLLLLRVGAGLAMTRRILRRSVVTGLLADGRPVLESQDLGVPAAVGLFRPSVVLPSGWREWEPAKLDAVLVHELSHVRRRDPAVHLLSASHRALLWFSPASWWMHGRIVQLAEDASDDAVLTVTPDRVSYAELLLQFMQRGNKRFYGEGVTMARYGRGGGRILRILDSTTLSRGLTRVGATTILAIAVPAVFLAAAVTPAPHESSLPASIPSAPSVPSALSQQPTSSPTPTAPRPSPSRLPSPDRTEQGEGESQAAGTGVSAAEPASSSPDEERDNAREGRYLIVDGNSMSGSWDSRDEPRLAKWRSRYGGQFAWFRREGRDYIVTDQTVLDQLRDAMSPQKEVNAKQATVNLMQADVNRHQDKVNHLQAEVNDAQAIVNKEQEKVNHLDSDSNEAQSRVNRMQSEVNARQSEVNSVQDGVNREQAVVNGQQAVVNRMQERASQVIERSIHLIFDDVMSMGLAQEAE